jgi:ceramide glucosyltransferase
MKLGMNPWTTTWFVAGFVLFQVNGSLGSRMSPRLEWLLVSWSLLAASWWGTAIWLVSRRGCRPLLRSGAADADSQTRPTISIFKPIPALDGRGLSPQLIGALESFVSQLDETAEMLLGIEETDATNWLPLIEQWRAKFPGAQLNVIVAARPQTFANPKVSWQFALASRARGQVWLWSDADVLLPAGGLEALRAEFAGGLLTCPYVVRRVGSRWTLLDALFVNVEFFPGVLLLRRLGNARFALGALMMFEAEKFRRYAKWEELGSTLADDFALGNALQPVTVSATVVETIADEPSWGSALRHYLRWHKTVRWCRPSGYAGQIIILPVLGWLVFAVSHPTNVVGWIGLFATAQIEMLTAVVLFQLIGCELRPWWTVGVWCVLRPLTWLACWLPWPVVWRSPRQVWRGPHCVEQEDARG